MTYDEYRTASAGRRAYIERRARKAGVSVRELLHPTILIRHYTTKKNAQAIVDSGWIYRESKKVSFDDQGFSHYWHQWNASYGMTGGELMERDWQAIGQWVWLSVNPPQCNAAMNEVYFEFDAADINAEKWLDYTERLTPTRYVRDALRGVRQKLRGDDMRDWWIAPSIDLSRCRYSLNTIRQRETA